jgi:glutaredoxin
MYEGFDMVKVTVLTTKTCPVCPSAKRLWHDVQKDHKFDYEEVDAMSEKGRDIVERYGIISVPTTLINGKPAFTGVPNKEKAIAAVTGGK